MNNDLGEFMLGFRRGQHTETHTVSIHMFNDWTEKVQVVRDQVLYDIPEYAAVYARYNKTTNETEIRFTWSTIEKGIV